MMAKVKREEVILVVDDSPDTLEVLHRSIGHMGFRVYSSESAEESIEIMKEKHIDLVITDYHMPFIGGLDLIHHVRDNYLQTEVMMITGYASVEGAVEAIKAGAEEYLAKPFTDDELEQAIERALEKLRIRTAKRAVPAKNIAGQYSLIGESNKMKRVFEAIKKAAKNSKPVLINGEIGSGRELTARIIHYESEQSGHPFITVNCKEIPDSIIEKEIFGSVANAENISSQEENGRDGAVTLDPGFLELAGKGTVFLNEISETSLAVQVKLLGVIAEREFTKVGDNKVRQCNCRIMASTSKDLIAMVGKGLFREDLFFRLNGINVVVPPLREREEDIILISRHLISQACQELGRSTEPELSDGVFQALLNHSWMGNIIELETVINDLVKRVDTATVEVVDLLPYMRCKADGESSTVKTLHEIEKDYIKEVLSRVDGNKSKAAELLGIDRKTLRDKLDK
jgi:two-component system, NtrC family, response regulator HydG